MQTVGVMADLNEPTKTGGAEPNQPPRKGSRTGVILVGLGVAAVLALGVSAVTYFRSLERQVAGLSEQAETLRGAVQRAEEQSQASAQQLAEAAASAQAAAEQREQAELARAESEARAQSAEQRASEAERQAEELRQQHEAELARLQEVLGQIAETRRTALGLVMTLGEDSIRFDFDRSEVKPEYREILNRIAGVLSTLKGYSIHVYGYTDDIGTAEYNRELSERRARAVRDVLVEAGVPPEIETRGFGEADPRVAGTTPQARAANRRVEIGLVYTTIGVVGPASPSR
jgi:outer membrane protein OmpA-like peptidoglycan-associated protein